MFNKQLKPNTIVRMGTVVGVVEGEDIYRSLVFNIYCGNDTKRKYAYDEISEVISEEYAGSSMFAYQVYNKIK